jgi:hypothetical protein
LLTVRTVSSPWSAAVNTDNSWQTYRRGQMERSCIATNHEIGVSKNLSEVEQRRLICEVKGTSILSQIQSLTQFVIFSGF